MNTINNARSRNTQNTLEKTYLDLLQRHPERPVNIVELCKKTKVNRATFYAHYTGIPDLQKRIEEKMTREMVEVFRNPELGSNIMTQSRIKEMLLCIRKNKPFYLAWYNSGRADTPSLVERFMKQDVSQEFAKYRVLYCRAGINAIIKNWLDGNCTTDPDTLAEIIVTLQSKTAEIRSQASSCRSI